MKKSIVLIIFFALFVLSCSSDDSKNPKTSTTSDKDVITDSSGSEKEGSDVDTEETKDSAEVKDDVTVDSEPDSVPDAGEALPDEDDTETDDSISVDEDSDNDSAPGCMATQCSIENKCYDNGTKHPTSLCLVCNTDLSTTDWSPATSGTICRVSSGECDVAEKCDGVNAACPEDTHKPIDTPCGNSNESICDAPDSCDGFGECRANYAAESTPCTDDGNLCNGSETCNNSGSCISSGPAVECGDRMICMPESGECGCDEENGYFLSADTTFCAFAGNNVPGSSQSKCYDSENEIACPTHESGLDWFGQDAQYRDNPQTLTIVNENGENVVHDSFTNLTWERDAVSTEKKSWEAAKSHCESKGDGWRIPTVKELATTVDFDFAAPVCDVQFCPPDAGWFWTSNEYKPDTSKAITIYFYTGDLRTNAKTESHGTRCVKGTPFNPSGVITSDDHETEPVSTDSLTALSWTKSLGYTTLKSALAQCEALVYGGHSDWRLPNTSELMSVMDYSKSSNAATIPGINPTNHWSSTTYIKVISSAVVYNFNTGISTRIGKLNNAHYVCVR